MRCFDFVGLLAAARAVISVAERIVEIPRYNVESFSHAEFDKVFLASSTPIILEGATICPSETLSTIGQSCIGKHQYSEQRGHAWAGLTRVDDPVSVQEFVGDMQNSSSRAPRYLFDVNPLDYCPNSMRSIEWPSHLNTVFSGQFLGQCYFPVYSLYISEQGFQTNFHIDSVHQAFVASMCQGSKRWRIIKNKEWALNVDAIGLDQNQRGVKFKNKIIFADAPKPYSTWGPSRHLKDTNVTVYEGVLKAGQILLVPPSALHAAETLESSLMAAMNDYTFGALDDVFKACKARSLEEDLPRGWHSAVDPESKRTYYWKDGMSQSQWEPPAQTVKSCEEHGLAHVDRDSVAHILKMRAVALRARQKLQGAPREKLSWLDLYGCSGDKYCKELRQRAQALGHGIQYRCTKSEVRSEL